MLKFFYIALGGATGAVLRYLFSNIGYRIFGSTFPWGTLLVNLVGSFFIGFLWELSIESLIPSNFRFLVLIGFLGAFTTFSSYTLETVNLLKDGEYVLAAINIFSNNILGISLVFLGALFFKFFLG